MLFTPGLSRADVVLDWNAVMVSELEKRDPFTQARVAAITQLAVFEAVNAVTGDYKPYLGTISRSPEASAEAAAVTAAHGVLKNYLPDRAADLDAARDESLAAIPEGPAKSAGIETGVAAANAIIAARMNDGSEPPTSYLPDSSEPGAWQPTPRCPATGGVSLHAPEVTPFGIRSGDQFRSDPPPELTSARYARAYNEVKELGGINSTRRPKDRADVAQLYAALLATSIWNGAASQVAAAQGKSISENARAFALINMANMDGLISVFDTKYQYKFWRPETAIRAADKDDNPGTDPDPTFEPFIASPCHPSYPSAHASLGHAAREVLERFYGARRHSITMSSPTVPGVSLQYSSFKEITDDLDDARIYGGIHFSFDQKEGAEQGRKLGRYVHRHNLRPVKGRTCEEEKEQ
jgi:hypothetical protein